MRAVADDLAAAGYFALVPDLFWRLEPGIQLSDKTDAEWQQAFSLMNCFDANSGVKDIQASIAALCAADGCNGKVGTVGYSWAGCSPISPPRGPTATPRSAITA